MQISLFTCECEHNRINKASAIYNRHAMNGNLKTNTSIINPVILVKKTNPAIYNYNYMYIDEFKRFYFITDIVNVRNDLWEIHAHVDVLNSFKNDILKSQVIIEKSEKSNNANMYYNDGSYVTDVRKDVELKEFPSGFNDTGSFILICAGGN